MRGWLYLTISLVVPQLWAVAVALAFERRGRRRRPGRAPDDGPPSDYSI